MAVKLYHEELRKFLNTNQAAGDKTLWKWLEKKGDEAVIGAKLKVGVRTGTLQRSIHKRHLGNLTGQYLWIGSERDHALLHHNGTKRHVITARPGRMLVFRGKGGMVYTTKVNHPGTRPNPYLSSQLRRFIA